MILSEFSFKQTKKFFFKTIKRRTKWKMNQIMILNYGIELALTNKYLEILIKCLKPKLFNEVFKTAFQIKFQEHYFGVNGK